MSTASEGTGVAKGRDQVRRSRRQLAIEIAIVVIVLSAALGLRARVSLIAGRWVFAGSDSYGYLKIADEWNRDHRLAYGPPPNPLQWYRRPVYPLFLLMARGDAVADVSGGPGWKRIQIAQIAVELFVLWPLVFFAVRRVGGRAAALLALALTSLYPPLIVFPSTVLSESLSMALCVAATAPLILALASPSPRTRRTYALFALAAAGAALAALTRPDGLLIGFSFLPIVLARRYRQIPNGALAAAATTFVVLFAPWPIRNLVHFGDMHLTDGMIDRFGADVPNYAGFWNWMRTWSKDERPAGFPASCFYGPGCASEIEVLQSLGAFDAAATDAKSERDEVTKLLAERARSGVSPAVSLGFERLARARRAAHPFRVLVELPVRRTIRAWWAPQVELAQNQGSWPPFFQRMVRHFRVLGRVLFIATLIAIALLLVAPGRRVECLVLAVPLFIRSCALGWTAFSLPRYVAPTYPLCFMLVSMGLVVVAQRGPKFVVALSAALKSQLRVKPNLAR